MKKFILVFTAYICLTSCVLFDSNARLSEQLSEHEARTLFAWADWQKKDLRDKIGPAPDFLVNYVQIDNRFQGFTQVPRPAEEWKPFAEDIIRAIEEFPEEVRRQLDRHVIGIFLVSDLGSSGYTEVLKDFAHHPLGFMVLDTRVLDQTANEWASWKENTPFLPCPGLEVRVLIEPEDRNNRKNALSYIILHELGHLVGVAAKAHVSWQDKGKPRDYAFASLSWTQEKGPIFSKWDALFPERSKIRFYAEEKFKLPGDKRIGIYADLVKTDFVSLYAATGVYDDFAEAYAMYVHVVLQQRPWQLTVLQNGEPVFTMHEPIHQDRCLNKKMFLAGLFEKESPLDRAADDTTANSIQRSR